MFGLGRDELHEADHVAHLVAPEHAERDPEGEDDTVAERMRRDLGERLDYAEHAAREGSAYRERVRQLERHVEERGRVQKAVAAPDVSQTALTAADELAPVPEVEAQRFQEATAEEELDDDDDWQYEEEEDDES